MIEIVISTDYGGFGLSDEAVEWLRTRRPDDGTKHPESIPRNDPYLVSCVRALGARANGAFANLKVVDIPDGVQWEIEDYDGAEWVAEKHRTWR